MINRTVFNQIALLLDRSEVVIVRIFFVIFSISCLGLFSSHIYSANTENNASPKVLFIYPMDNGFPFWDSQRDFAQAVSKAFNFEMRVAYSPPQSRNRFGAAAYIERLVEDSSWRPDLVITSFWLGSEQKILATLQKYNIDLISVNSDVSEEQFKQLGYPREKYKNWLFHLSPDDTLAGKQLATAILQSSRNKICAASECNINLFAVTGLRYSLVSEQRVRGLERSVLEDQHATVLNTVYGRWDRDYVTSLTPRIINRHNDDINAYWFASDIMAFGLLDGMQELAQPMNENVIIGSMDWSPEVIDRIREGKVHMSLGGHFMEAGWGLILYYDYLNNPTLASSTASVFKTQMSMLNEENIDSLGSFLQSPTWSNNVLRAYSRHLNPQQPSYQFNPQHFISAQIKQQN